MTRKPNILMVGDMPGWAFHNIITFVRSNVQGYNFYYDYTIYNPNENSKVSSDFEVKSHHVAPRILKKTIPFHKTVLLKGLVYRIINCLNQLGLLSYNGDGQFRRIRKDNTYDMVLFLDYYMDKDADFGHIKAKTRVKGIFTAQFPPKGIRIDPKISLEEFYKNYLIDSDALLVGAPCIAQTYSDVFTKPIFFANMAYDEQVFCPTSKDINRKEPFIVGWTGNPDRDFKGFYSHVMPAVEHLKNLGYSIELRTQFDGTLNSLADFWNKVDVALITSEADAGPSMFMEASLCGVPSVSTRIGLPNDVIVDKVNGLFCDRDVADIIDKLIFLIDNKKIHREMKDNIRATFISKLGVEVQTTRWKLLFNAVLNE